ncbi:MAG: hypothetical protein KJO50_04570, partial [Bacteroidia bacterium]|nr:hypothetical protein [Bacteroidia bacterium]
MNRAVWLLVCVVVSSLAHSQSIKTIDLNIPGEILDLATINNSSIHIVSSDGIYRFIHGEIQLVSENSMAIALSSNKYNRNQQLLTYPSLQGGLSRVDKNREIKYFSGNSDIKSATLHQNKVYQIDSTLRRFENNSWEEIVSLENDQSAYWDLCSESNNLWLSNYSTGVYKIDSTGNKRHFTSEDGLFDNQCTSLCPISNGVIVGHKGGISVINDNELKSFSLKGKIGSDPVLEIESGNDSDFYFLTPGKILRGSPSELEILDIELDPDDEWVALHFDHQENLWLLSKKKLFAFTESPVDKYVPNNKEANKLSFYEIRNNVYHSDGTQVYRFSPDANKWLLNPRKKAPKDVIRTKEGNTVLVFNNDTGIKLDRKTASNLGNFRFPDNERIQSINEIDNRTYVSTNKNIYELNGNDYELLSNKPDNYYKISQSNHGTFAYAENSIYKLDGDSFLEILPVYQNSKFPESTNQFEYNTNLFTFTENAIWIYNIRENKSYSIDLSPLKILDILRNENQLILLSSKSIVYLQLDDLVKEELTIINVHPLNDLLSDGELHLFDNNTLWVNSSKLLAKVELSGEMNNNTPKLRLEKISTQNNTIWDTQNKLEFNFNDL